MKEFKETANYIKEQITEIPKIAIILGSGLGTLADEIIDKIIIPYKDIPNFPVSTVPGHKGELIFGKLNNTPILAMNGRFHYYEGYDLKTTTYPIRIFKLLGIETLILTNAAGGINLNFQKGDLMIIEDQLSFFAESVLRGPNLDEFGDRFIDMSNVYTKEYIEILKPIMTRITGKCLTGVYAYMKGPTYETPAEIKALRTLGADAVGMSTVPEAVIAKHCGIKCIGITCITNMAAGINSEILSHDDVKETAKRAESNFKQVIKELVTKIN
ncbi:MAG: purine-nucleoside phosphorylase [Bacilli bacterium]|nr:purine-nucleoside phosphorylase [Bacilli bacterium]